MARPKRVTQKDGPEPAQDLGESPPIPEELQGVGELKVHMVAGKPASYAFSLDFPTTLTAIVHSEETGGFSAEVPALPGCFTEGETLEELEENLREAAEGWLKAHHDLVSSDLLRENPEGFDER